MKESAENYLETILMLSHGGAAVRSIDIAEELGYSRPSVSVAMKNLREAQHIKVDAEGYITLTKSGRSIAQAVYERHVLLSDWLMRLGVDKKTALDDACKLEHGMSAESFAAIKKHIESWKKEQNDR